MKKRHIAASKNQNVRQSLSPRIGSTFQSPVRAQTSQSLRLTTPQSIKSTSSADQPRAKLAEKVYGREGELETVEVNLFKIKINKPLDYYHYNIDMQISQMQFESKEKSSVPKSKKVKKESHDKVFQDLFKSHFKGIILPVFDGEKNFYSIQKLPKLDNKNFDTEIPIDFTKKVTKNVKVQITKPVNSNLQNLMNLNPRWLGNADIIPFEQQALDILLRNGARINGKVILGPNIFKNATQLDVSDFFKIENVNKNIRITEIAPSHIRFGTSQATKICEESLFLNVDRSIQIFIEGGKIIDIMNKIIPGVTNREISNENLTTLDRCFKELKFKTTHTDRKYTFKNFSKTSVKNTFFNLRVANTEDENTKDQKTEPKIIKTNVFDYFKSTYKDQIKDMKGFLPCVITKGFNNSDNYFPLESVYILNDQIYKRKLSPSLQSFITRNSSQVPIERFKNIVSYVESIRNDSIINGIDYLHQFGNIEIERTPKKVKARILRPPVILLGEKRITPYHGSFEEKENFKFYKPVTGILRNWAIVFCKYKYNKQVVYDKNNIKICNEKIEQFHITICNASKIRGMDLEEPNHIDYDFNYTGFDSVLKKYNEIERTGGIKLIVFVMFDDDKDDSIYRDIKVISELEKFNKKFTTQCLNQHKSYWLTKGGSFVFSKQFILNVLLKINTKLGGVNQTISEDSRVSMMKSNSHTMFIGIDVTHPSPGDNLSQSISACVATYTSDYVECLKDVRVQEKVRKEVVNLKSTILKFLKCYQEKNNRYPFRIIVYRDGIGEGDFQNVINFELKDIKNACKEFKQEIKVTYIMVQKRHNIRMKRESNKQKLNNFNLLPGTVIDREITSHKYCEFYLNAHASPLGTARPGKYVVLHDESNFTGDELQKMTYYTCFLYPRCLKSISIPAYVEYAHHLCTRGAHYFKYVTKAAKSTNQTDLSRSYINDLNEALKIRKSLEDILYFI